MPLASDSSKSINKTNSYQKRLLFLGKFTDGSLVIFGIVLICTGLARLLNIYDSQLSTPQIFQGLLGLLLFVFGILRKTAFFLTTYKNTQTNNFKRFLGALPFAGFLLFLIYRIQLEDIKAYKRLVEEGSLVEWSTFIFLLLAAFFFLITAKEEVNKLISKFILATSGFVFVLAMEEVSWGQMIFNWRSPQFFAKLNSQQETNIHNLLVISGEPNTLIIALVLLSLSIFCVLRWYLGIKNKIQRNTIADIILPPLFLIGYFSIGALVYFALVLQMIGIEVPVLIPSDQELVECFFALGVLLHSCKIYVNGGSYLTLK